MGLGLAFGLGRTSQRPVATPPMMAASGWAAWVGWGLGLGLGLGLRLGLGLGLGLGVRG